MEKRLGYKMDQEHIKVLLIEDNPGDARLILEIMNEEKNILLDLESTDCLKSGLKLIANGEVDVVILDLGLPDSQGLETFTKTYAMNPQLPIIVLSGLKDEELAIKAVRNGAQDYLVKGQVNGNLLVRAIQYAIERKRIEERLRESEDKFRTLAEKSPNMIFINKRGRIVYANQRLEEIMGYKSDEFYSPDFDFLTLIAPESRDTVQSNFKRHMEGEELLPYEYSLITKENKRIEAIITTKLIHYDGENAILGIVTDISERRRAEKELQESFRKLRRTLDDTVKALASLVDIKDPYTAGHQQRVTKLACAIAKEMGLPNEQIEAIKIAGSIHDIGKISIPAEILSKPTSLSEGEISIIQSHPQVGYNILKEIEFPWPVAEIVLQHHERMLGSGYPRGIIGEDILLEARILGVADVVEAMSSHRPYRPAYGLDKALQEIHKNRAILYDPVVVDACLRLFQEKGFKFEYEDESYNFK